MSRRPAPRLRLSERDVMVLRDVGRLRFATGDQLRRLHFPDGTEVGRQRRAQAALRRLTTDGYLFRLPRRIGGPGSGSERFIYQLGYRGQRLVWPDRSARSPQEVGWQFVEHAIAVGHPLVELIEAERRDLVSDLTVDVEPTCWRQHLGVGGSARWLKPDLAVRLCSGQQKLAWFIEVDRATEGLRRIRAKASQYLDYWRTGLEQDRIGTFPRVAWSVPDPPRAEAIRRTLSQLPSPAEAMFVVATAAETTALLIDPPIGATQPNQSNNQAKEVRHEPDN